MTVSAQTPANSSTGNGVTTVYPYTFKILQAADLEVAVDGVVKALNTDYTVTGAGNNAGGNVIFSAAPASGTVVTRRRNMQIVRSTDYQDQGELPAETLNDDQDAPILMLQQVNEQVGRALKVPIGEDAIGFLPAAADRAGMFMGFDADGDPAALSGTGTDSSLRTDLVAAGGSALVGFRADIASPTTVSLQAALRSMPLTPQQCGAEGDGTTDDTQAFQRFAAASARRKYIPPGTYKLTTLADPLDFQPGDFVEGAGDLSILDASGSTLGAGEPVLRIVGTLTSLGAIMGTGGVGAGEVDFALTTVAGLSVGDVLITYNSTNGSWSGHRNEYRAGEFIQIGNIDALTIYPTAPLYDAYADTIAVYKLGGTGGRLANFKILTPANQSMGWQIADSVNPSVERVTTGGSTTYAGGEFKRCYGIYYEGKTFQSTPSTDDEYGVTVSNCQGGSMFIEGATGGRHPISLGGGDYVCCVPTRGINVYGNSFNNLGPTGSGNLHGNTEDCKFFGISFANGSDVGGANHYFGGCKFRGNTNSGIAIYCGEPVKGSFIFDSPVIETYVDPNASGFAVVELGNIDADVKGALRFIFNSPTFSAPSGTTFMVRVNITAGSYAPDVIINNPTIVAAPSLTQLLRLERSAGAATIGNITIGGEVTGLPSGASYVVNAGSGLTVTNYRLPMQSGSKSVEVSTAASTYTGAVTLRHPYPVAPAVVTTLSTPTVGGDRALSVASSVGTSSFDAEVATCDGGNFAGVDTAVVRWIARVAD